MGEVVVSSEERIEIMEVTKEEVEKQKENNKEGNTSSMVRWETFLPKMGLRILLVEADDSTRQIIGALLRKCSYKVASVADGLKAWEVLKGRPHNIDLILTEADLPSISGYALLTLIMEHEVCKNIPVIMMSTHDSVSVVYKCMLKGAVDFLVKPIRINELKNLWQHVWRRHYLNRGAQGPQDESVGQEKLEATAENNANSDRSSSSKTRALMQDECIKKGSDAESSCGNPDVEAESNDMAQVDNFSCPKQGVSPVFDLIIEEHDNIGNSNRTPESATAGSDTAICNSNTAIDQNQKEEQQSRDENLNFYKEDYKEGDTFPSSSREEIDLIGALDNHSTRNACSIFEVNKLEPSQQLDLTLRRFLPSALENKTNDEMLNHSNASAFTRYVNKALHHISDSNPNSIFTPKENTTSNSTYHLSNNNHKSKYRKVISLPTNNLTKEVENEYINASQKLFPVPIPEKGVRIEVCPTFSAQLPSPSLSSTNQQINSYHQFSMDLINGRHHFHNLEQSPRLSSNQSMTFHDQKMESLEDRVHFSSVDDRSASSSLHNDVEGRVNCERENGQGQVSCELNRQRSLQREAALNKFRLKRKERCFEKKVRYESRKKLAEQRPRVKGQFVRQVPPDPPPKSEYSGGNTVIN